jgi:DEAD/DEAH box helicase domain-containing protein
MRRITFDIETTGKAGAPFDMSTQELTIVGVHDSETDEYSSYLKEELPRLWPLFERADVIIGYNSDHFDIPILNRYYAGDLGKIKSIDLLKEIKNVLGRRLKLDSVAQATLGAGKIAAGTDAVKWWAEGNIEKVREYCLDDVRITKELYDYALKNGSVKYKDFDGIREIKLDTSTWEQGDGQAAMTHTLPF